MMDRCLDAQLLAAFAERKLKRSEMPEVLAHLERCPTCMSSLKAAMDLMEPRSEKRPWLYAAAAVAILLGIAPFAWRALRSSGTDQLVRLAPRSARAVQVRLSGGFEWAPYRGPMRATDAGTEAQRMKLVGAAGELVERADAEKSAAAQHTAGIGLVLVDKPEDAVTRLRAAAERSPHEARIWSDLAAAEYMTALRHGRVSLYPVALAHADRALAVDANYAEALFNRALILERLGLTHVAREAWDRFLRADPSSKWANEAREHLKRLPASTGESQFKRDQPLLESAAIRGDQPAVEAIVDRYRQQSRTWGEAEYLGRWGAAEANQQLAISRAIGDALARLSGESLLRDAVAAIDHATPAQRAALAEAHVVYRRGRIAYSRREPAAAEPDLRDAAARFASAGSPMSLVARYFAANTRFDQDDAATARHELEALLGESTHAALSAQIRWELTLCAILDEDWSAAEALASPAEDAFRRLGEKSNQAVMQGLLATSLLSLGRPDEGWAARVKAFAIESREARGDRLPASVSEAARVELRLGRFESARALLDVEEDMHRLAANDARLSNTLVREALLEEALGDADAATRTAREAMKIAQRIADPAFRARAVADANFAAGAAALRTEPLRSRELLSHALEHYRTTRNSFYLPEAHLLRARASLRVGERDQALRDLEDGIDVGTKGSGVFDARRALFEEIIPLRLDRGDAEGAFADAERARGITSPSAGELRNKLAGTGIAVLELVVLPREIIAFAVTAGDLAVSRNAIAQDRVAALAARNDDEAARALFDLLIAPSHASLRNARALIVVPDAALQQVSFAALLDGRTKRRLLETMTVAVAPSAAALEPADDRSGRPSAVAIALPAGDGSDTVALPETEAELADIRQLYGKVTEIKPAEATLSTMAQAAANAGVIHIAGHTEPQAGLGEAALLFRGPGSALEPVTWSRIASMRFGAPIVVLAACETLRAPVAPHARTLSLGGGFLAAGATDVIGTLAPVPDNEARDFFRAVHRELAQGRSAAAALQRAQIEAIALGSGSAWRFVAVLTNRIERRETHE